MLLLLLLYEVLLDYAVLYSSSILINVFVPVCQCLVTHLQFFATVMVIMRDCTGAPRDIPRDTLTSLACKLGWMIMVMADIEEELLDLPFSAVKLPDQVTWDLLDKLVSAYWVPANRVEAMQALTAAGKLAVSNALWQRLLALCGWTSRQLSQAVYHFIMEGRTAGREPCAAVWEYPNN